MVHFPSLGNHVPYVPEYAMRGNTSDLIQKSMHLLLRVAFSIVHALVL